MTTVREYHNQAMRLAQLAVISRESGDAARAIELARQALDYEIQAANAVPLGVDAEPTRSILYRSAASLAYQSREFLTAHQLIMTGLTGDPPARVRQELDILLEQVRFELFLQTSRIKVANGFGISLKGQGVGYGTVPYTELTRRGNAALSITERSVQRKMDRNYQASGQIAEIYRAFVPLISTMPGSFVVQFELARSEAQQLSYLINLEEIIDEIIVGIELVNNDNLEQLREIIPNEAYFKHFISMAKEIAPDGQFVDFVGIYSKRHAVSLTKQRKDISLIQSRGQESTALIGRERITVQGILDFASARQSKKSSRSRRRLIGLTTQDGKEYDITVAEGMEDLVRSYWEQYVSVTGYFDGKKLIEPEDIQPAPSPL